MWHRTVTGSCVYFEAQLFDCFPPIGNIFRSVLISNWNHSNPDWETLSHTMKSAAFLLTHSLIQWLFPEHWLCYRELGDEGRTKERQKKKATVVFLERRALVANFSICCRHTWRFVPPIFCFSRSRAGPENLYCSEVPRLILILLV